MPSHRLSNDDILEIVRRVNAPHLSEEQISAVINRIRILFRVAGCKYRHVREDGEPAKDFAVCAAKDALERAGLRPEDIDLLIYVGVGRGWVEPGMASFFTHALGMTNATGFDILDACLSWLRALHIAHNFLKNGVYRNIMVLNAEFNRDYNNFTIRDLDELDYRFAQFTIGESATATVLSNGQCSIEPHFEFATDGSLHALCKIPLPQISQYTESEMCPVLDPLVFFAYSAELFKTARRMISHCYQSSAELQNRQFDIAFAHCASKSIIDSLDQALGYNGRTVNVFEEFGNTVSASIPTAMCWAIENGKLKRDMKMMLVMGSAGFSVGFCHMVY
jgi:3-oxoacyl-[acyl-carrier-protein] synthase III